MSDQDRLADEKRAMWPLLFAVPVFVMVVAYQLGPVRFHSDDRPWLAAAQNGLLEGFVSSDPYGHFRSTFHAWLSLLNFLGVSGPTGFGFALLAHWAHAADRVARC